MLYIASIANTASKSDKGRSALRKVAAEEYQGLGLPSPWLRICSSSDVAWSAWTAVHISSFD